ncbi:MAG: hypothetical protein K0R28_1849 [Paenibacillus sp.]|nr:hypothetical protein [Paenibacillus sp.]
MINRKRWKTALTTIVLSASLLSSALPVSAEAALTPTDPGIGGPLYSLPNGIRAELKTVALNKSASGTQIAAVVRLRNDGAARSRVPDFELRAASADGIDYELAASSANVRSLMGKESADLTYLVTVDRQDEIGLTGLKFVEVDEYAYPKRETTLLEIPMSRVWNSAKSDFDQPSEPAAWGTPFKIPGTDSRVVYTPVGYTEHNGSGGHAYVVTLLAENKGGNGETVESFRLDGKAAGKTYAGQRIEKDPVTLAAGEKKYVHYAIPTDSGIVPDSLMLMTTGTFAGAGQNAAAFEAGALKIAVPASKTEPVNTDETYETGSPIAFDPLNRLVNADTEISLVELHMHENEGAGFKSVVAKFKLHNKSGSTSALPAFGAEIVGTDGSSYAGSRQAQTSADMMPNLSYVVSYSFMVPASENGERLAIRMLDNVSAAPYGSTIASFRAKVQGQSEDAVMSFYPFNVKLNYWTVNGMYNAAAGYSYRMKLDLDVESIGNVVADANFSKLKIELTDTLDRVIGSQSIPFTGTNKLISGEQTIAFSNLYTDHYQYPLVIKLYETIDTPNGEANRLVKTLKQ